MEEREDFIPESEETSASGAEYDINNTANATEEVAEASEAVEAPDWSFGAAPDAVPAAREGGMGRFFCIFGAVIALCAALLIATLFLGENGIRIYRTITHDRTVFVHENGTGEGGLLAPEEAAALVSKSTVTVTVRTKTGTGHGSGFVYTTARVWMLRSLAPTRRRISPC